MRRRALLLSLLAAPFAAPRAVAAAAERPLRVVASFSVLADLVREVGGADVEVHALVGPDADAHVYEPTPADARRLAAADLVVVNGLGFEGWLARLVRASGYDGKIVVATEGVAARPGRRHPDPHAWQDPRLVRTYVRNVAGGLRRARPPQAARFERAAGAYVDRLDALDAELRERFARVPPARRRVVTTHDAFAYFGAAYGIEFLPLQGWTTAEEPSAADVARLVRTARSRGAVAAFVENVGDPRPVRTLAADAGLRVGERLYSDALAGPGHPASTYLGMIRHNAEALLAAIEPPPAAAPARPADGGLR